MSRRPLPIALALTAILALSGTLQAQRESSGPSAYPNVDKPVTIAPGETVQLLIRSLNDGGPAMRIPGKRLDLVYSTTLPASDAAGRRAQADRAAQIFGPGAVDLGARFLSIGICDTRECAQRRHPPSDWYLYERTNTGWKRVP